MSSDLLFSREYFANPEAVLRVLRERAPVHPAVLPNKLPVWVVTSYEDAKIALTDERLRKSSARLSEIMLGKLSAAGGDARLSGLFRNNMLVMDPPDHTRLRKLLARDFTARRIEKLRPRIEQLTAELLDDIPSETEVDLIERFAFPLPMTVICELLGVPEADRAPMRAWSQALMGEVPPAAMITASEEMSAYITELIAAKRASPGDDLLSALTRAADDGDRLTEAELLSTCILLVVAGHETTVSLISSSADWLLRDHLARRRLLRDPGLMPQAVEELLRLTSPIAMATARYTAEAVTFGDVTVPAGEVVLVALGSANRDPARFVDPDELNLDRSGGGHLAFGHGIHFCIGAPLARLEGEIALRQLLQRFPRFARAVAADELKPRRSHTVSGWRSLPVILDPA